jgi:hypothetical protein
MEHPAITLTFENLSAIDIKTLKDATLFDDLCIGFTLQGVKIDGIPFNVLVRYGNDVDVVSDVPSELASNTVTVKVRPNLRDTTGVL